MQHLSLSDALLLPGENSRPMGCNFVAPQHEAIQGNAWIDIAIFHQNQNDLFCAKKSGCWGNIFTLFGPKTRFWQSPKTSNHSVKNPPMKHTLTTPKLKQPLGRLTETQICATGSLNLGGGVGQIPSLSIFLIEFGRPWKLLYIWGGLDLDVANGLQECLTLGVPSIWVSVSTTPVLGGGDGGFTGSCCFLRKQKNMLWGSTAA